MKLVDIILEADYKTYEAMAQVIHSQDSSVAVVTDLLRALPGVTTVTATGSDEASRSGTFKVKIISQKEAKVAFTLFKKNAMDKYSDIEQVKVGEKTIEQK